MNFFHRAHLPTSRISHKKLQLGLYLGMLGAFMLIFLPISVLFSPNGGLVLSFLILAALVGWMQWRLNRLQMRVFKTEQQLRRLSAQKSKINIQPQTVSHLEAENYFSPDQTRH